MAKMHIREQKLMVEGQWQETKQRAEKSGQGEHRACWTCGETGHISRGVEREATTICTPLMKMRVKTLKNHLTIMKNCTRDQASLLGVEN